MRNRDLDQDASTSKYLCFRMLCNHKFSFTSYSFQDRFFVEFETFAHTSQTYEGRHCLQYGIMAKVQ